MVDQLQPAAVRELAATMGNRKSPSLRFAAACKLLDLGQARKERERGGKAPEDGFLGLLANALHLRTRAAAAVDAQVIREDPVTPTAAPLPEALDSKTE